MCGIVVSIVASGDSPSPQTPSRSLFSQTLAKLKDVNSARGPDSQATVTRVVKGHSSDISISFTASVLHLRGDRVIPQPHTTDLGDVLCWNGEIFEGLDVSLRENDGTKLFDRLTSLGADVPKILASIEGPYAFVFYRAQDRSLFYGRDPLGRRSLLSIKFGDVAEFSPMFLASASIGPSDNTFLVEETPPDAVYQITFEAKSAEPEPSIPLVSYTFSKYRRLPSDEFTSKHSLNRDITRVASPPHSTLPYPLGDDLGQVVEEFTQRLEYSVSQRVLNIPPASLPFAARLGILFSGGIDCSVLAFLANKFIPRGEPIELINVAFQNNRSLAASKKTGGRDIFAVPDRETGIKELEELRNICLDRQWNFVEVNVAYEEYVTLRQVVEHLMYPSNTVMDRDLAMPLYFASRGIGQLYPLPNETLNTLDDSPTATPYTCTARVLLSGLGSDELLGGYSRHRAAYRNNGWVGLIEELQLDLDRLPTRNLGRDDRVISANAREVRYPYLSLPLVSYLAKLPVHVKLDPRLAEGTGDKRLLRLAAEHMGLHEAASRRKRAMQFGSRSAKMTGEKEERRGDNVLFS